MDEMDVGSMVCRGLFLLVKVKKVISSRSLYPPERTSIFTNSTHKNHEKNYPYRACRYG